MSAAKQIRVIVDGTEYIVEVGDLSERPIRAHVNQRTYQVRIPDPDTPVPPRPQMTSKPVTSAAAPSPVPAAPAPVPAGGAGALASPMPGDIIEVFVKPGDAVTAGQELCSLEAMKMKNAIRAPHAAKIAEVHIMPGQEVCHGQILFTFE
ncbi:MAG: acetyl-CoA carboxylase biotin carboxyl carrier protein subunit [Anaerolineales bacterium]|nr:acetyl-CoA carboxylase biotin carboxyl carrier protein subunit [Anaerolineales bacterium]